MRYAAKLCSQDYALRSANLHTSGRSASGRGLETTSVPARRRYRAGRATYLFQRRTQACVSRMQRVTGSSAKSER